VKVLVCSMLLNALETWTLSKDDTQKLEAFEMWVRRAVKTTAEIS